MNRPKATKCFKGSRIQSDRLSGQVSESRRGSGLLSSDVSWCSRGPGRGERPVRPFGGDAPGCRAVESARGSSQHWRCCGCGGAQELATRHRTASCWMLLGHAARAALRWIRAHPCNPPPANRAPVNSVRSDRADQAQGPELSPGAQSPLDQQSHWMEEPGTAARRRLQPCDLGQPAKSLLNNLSREWLPGVSAEPGRRIQWWTSSSGTRWCSRGSWWRELQSAC